MGNLKKLAGETAIYGLSTTVARIINFFLVPLYTRTLSTETYGVYTEIMSYIAVFQVLFAFGMETAFFRFANKDGVNANKVFSTILIFLTSTSLAVLAAGIMFSTDIADMFGYTGRSEFIWCSAAILAIDSFTAVIFARLRYMQKVLAFGIMKTIKILSEVGFNFLLFFVFPTYAASHPDSFLLKFLSPVPDGGYILFAILGSCIISLILFLPALLRIKFTFSPTLWWQLMIYAIPLVLTQLPGVLNDVTDRILFRYFSPEGTSYNELQGIFNANVKLAVFMTLFVQMFRYAAEPFFFSQSNKSDQRKTYVDVMKYFVIFCVFIFLVIALYIDIFKLFIGKEFRDGVGVVPVMLVANILLGINFNLSMWYKMSGQTKFAISITLSGLIVTIIINAVFMPLFGYYAAACGHFFSYLVMIIVSWQLCKKHYPIPYDWKNVTVYITFGVLLFVVSRVVSTQNNLLNFAINSILILAYLFFIIKKEKINIKTIKQLIKRR
ncbi:MAG: polysaccharide biosynthesis C-terminal domain-containing protein [Prevotellaceae bacterium]|jgi:O-antigen/teichoic acid export membrane protein|nr:polysaccharide biosynthesis C-terminal domain-containing protein [Prevotellaceae bacterium]